MIPALAPWRSPLEQALHNNRSQAHSRYVQLATVRPNGRPANRTVVFRGFTAVGNELSFVTDARSEKCEHIHHQPWGEVCWYFTETREQFRLGGELRLIGVDSPVECQDLRQAGWQRLSDAARSQFFWPHPGEPRVDPDRLTLSTPDPLNPPSSFCMVILSPTEVDHLQLQGDPHQRQHYYQPDQPDSDGVYAEWRAIALNP